MDRKRRLAEVYTVQDLSDSSWATWAANPGVGNTYVLSLLCSRENSEVESYKEVARAKFLSDDSLELVTFYDLLPHRLKAMQFLPNAISASGIRVRGCDSSEPPEGFRILPASYCLKCSRVLTRPVSIDTGMGEICSGHKKPAGSKFAAAKRLTVTDMRAAIIARHK